MSSHAEDHEVIMIDTWKFSLRGQPEQLQNHLDDLVGEEQQRIHQGIFPELAERSTRSRLGLRWILGSYLDCQPREVPLENRRTWQAGTRSQLSPIPVTSFQSESLRRSCPDGRQLAVEIGC